MAPITRQRTRRPQQTKPGLKPLNIIEQRRRTPPLGGPPRDRRRLQHSTDRPVDMLHIPQRFQHPQIIPKITKPGHQRFTTFKLDAFAPDTPLHRLAAGDSTSNALPSPLPPLGMQLPAARRLYARTPSLWIVGQTGTVVAVLTDNPATRKMLRETTSRQCSGDSSAPLVVGRTAPQSPAARPTAAPPRPMSCCERFISWCTLVPPSKSAASAPADARNQPRVFRPRSAAAASSPPISASR